MNWPLSIPDFLILLEEKLSKLYDDAEAKSIVRYFWDYSFDIPWSIVWEEKGMFSPDSFIQAEAGAKRLLTGEPVQYVVGKAHFYGYDFQVNEAVLIPRPETEGLVVWMKEEWKKMGAVHMPRLLDIGTGSGCIPLTLGMELHKAGYKPSPLLGMDVSQEALEVARKNGGQFPLLVEWIDKDVLTASHDDFFDMDIIVSNPPYVPLSEQESLHQNVRDHEPHTALFVPNDDPLLFYKKIAKLGQSWLSSKGLLFFEIHMDYGKEVVEMLQQMGYQDVELQADLSGRDRMVMARNGSAS
ncbi:MAG: peptide chain release factor N(5)-glutamine methyltransferase [Bacteroidota bacterium]